MARRSSLRWLVIVGVLATALFIALTIAVTSTPSLRIDTRAFEIADDLRAPWLDAVMRVVTTFGLIAIVGSAVVAGGVILLRRRERSRAAALVAGAGLAWVCVWLVKALVARPRPPDPLVGTTGHSYPSGHAANSVGWLALAIALSAVLPTKRWRVAAVAAGGSLAVLVGLSRIYLRAHYVSDVLAGAALAVAAYVLAAIGGLVWQARLSKPSAARPAPTKFSR